MSWLVKLFPSLEPYAIAIEMGILISILVGTFFLGWHVKGQMDAGATLKAQQKAVVQGNEQLKKDSASAQEHAAERVKIEYQDRIVTEKVYAAASNPQYRCQLQPADLNLLNKAIDGGE